MKDNIFLDVHHLGLGDSIALFPLANILSQNYNVFYLNKFNFLFEQEHKNIFFITPLQIYKENTRTLISYNDNTYSIKDTYIIGYHFAHIQHNHNQPPTSRSERNSRLSLQKQFAKFLNIDLKKEIKPKIHINNNYQKIKEKYVCICTQTTIQSKYWNYVGGWEIIVDYLKKLNYRVICIDKEKIYGNPVYLNKIPANAEDFTGKPLDEVVNIINGCDFLIGLDSGLSWIAWALNKKVVQILGLTGKAIAFENEYSIVNENVCNSCFSDKSVNQFDLDTPFQDFLLCPKLKNTKRMFECTKQITPQMIIDKINIILHSANTNHHQQS
jgi:autotransporter strand-loop-strand O-heptosyltransferase